MIRDLVKSDANILHHEIKPCGVNVDRHFIAKTLIENMFHHEGVGISANQIGMDVRAFAMIRDIEHNEVIVCFNPAKATISPVVASFISSLLLACIKSILPTLSDFSFDEL